MVTKVSGKILMMGITAIVVTISVSLVGYASRNLRTSIAQFTSFNYLEIADASDGQFNYGYGPAIMKENGRYHVFFCSQGSGTPNGGYGWDAIRYTTSTDGMHWTPPVVKITAYPTTVDGLVENFAACDPSVVYFNGYYYLYYSNAYNNESGGNQTMVTVARSATIDGEYAIYTANGTWEVGARNPKIIIYPEVANAPLPGQSQAGYGAGQQTVVAKNGQLYMWYTDDSRDITSTNRLRLRISDDPVRWMDKPVHDLPALLSNEYFMSVDIAYDASNDRFSMVGIAGQHAAPASLVTSQSTDGLNWSPLQTIIPSDQFPNFANNIGAERDRSGTISSTVPLVGFGAPFDLAENDIWGNWDLYATTVPGLFDTITSTATPTPTPAPTAPAGSRWYIKRSSDASAFVSDPWGSAAAPYGDIAVPGDYDGDGKTDDAVWRQSDFKWYVRNSSNGASWVSTPWGSINAPYNDVAVQADYDGDGKTDPAVWRRAEGKWYILKSSEGYAANAGVAWSDADPSQDIPVPADYDGDGKADLAVWNGTNTFWKIKKSSDGTTQTVAWGASYAPYFDIPVPGDYDGDHKADVAVWRKSDSIWYIRNSSNGSIQSATFGDRATDVPVVADYDGDRKVDIAVWNGISTKWKIRKSSGGTEEIAWGASYAPYFDIPVPGNYDGTDPDGKKRADPAIWRTGESQAASATTFRGIYSPPPGVSQVELFQDTNVSAGLRAQWSCTAWESDQGSVEGLPGGLQIGNCTGYQTPRSGYAIRTLPELGPPVDQGKYWHLNEGYHRGPMSIPPDITLAPGEDLQIFRTEVNGKVVEDSANKIHLQHFNNQGIAPGSPGYDTKLVREFVSDRHGKVTLYHNTKNEIRNVATDQGPKFATDTWPHVYLDHKFKQLIDLSQFSSMEFSANVDVPLIHELSGWTGPYKGSAVQMVVLLRKKSNPFVALWLVNTLYSNEPSNYQESLSGDQWGIAMYRANVSDVGGPLVPGGTPRTIHVDVLGNMRKAALLNSALGKPEDYYLDSIEIGNESLGYQEYKINLSNLSMKGTLAGTIASPTPTATSTPTSIPTPLPTHTPAPTATPTPQQCSILCTSDFHCCAGQRCVIPSGKLAGRCQ